MDLQWYRPYYRKELADAQLRKLLMSDQARSDANPILPIDENDVTAGHAASNGQVDPEGMYFTKESGSR